MISNTSTVTKRFQNIRSQSVSLCKPLEPEDFVVQPIVDVSPPKWHLAHTTWFFEQFILIPHKKDYKWYNEDYPYFFNSYYETVGSRVLRPNRGNMTRPTTDDILRYRIHVDHEMEEFLEKTALDQDLVEVMELGLQHEQQHQELLVTDIKYILGNNPLFPVYNSSPVQSTHGRAAGWVSMEQGIYTVGHTGEGFSFDNEHGRHDVFLHAFEVMDRLVTNEEYLEFLEYGGYSQFQYWLAEGWDWVNQNAIEAPQYWAKVDGVWMTYTLNGFEKLNPSEPVTHISYFEADAYARWKGLRLPTEFEWEAMAEGREVEGNFVESENFRPVSNPDSDQLFGDVWEWTSSAYAPYPFYNPPKGALGEYNGKFMVNQMVLRGGSCATPQSHIRATYRNFWHPNLRWQFNGIRLARHI